MFHKEKAAVVHGYSRCLELCSKRDCRGNPVINKWLFDSGKVPQGLPKETVEHGNDPADADHGADGSKPDSEEHISKVPSENGGNSDTENINTVLGESHLPSETA